MKELKKYLIDGEEVTQEKFEERLEEELENEVEEGVDGWIDLYEEKIEVCGHYVSVSKILRECLPSLYNDYKLNYEENLKLDIEDQFFRGAVVSLNCCDFEIEEIEEEEDNEDDRSEMPWDYGKHFD